jgi:hypothetical protein
MFIYNMVQVSSRYKLNFGCFFNFGIYVFGPKKEITPSREVLFHRIYPVATRKGLNAKTKCWIFPQSSIRAGTVDGICR